MFSKKILLILFLYPCFLLTSFKRPGFITDRKNIKKTRNARSFDRPEQVKNEQKDEFFENTIEEKHIL